MLTATTTDAPHWVAHFMEDDLEEGVFFVFLWDEETRDRRDGIHGTLTECKAWARISGADPVCAFVLDDTYAITADTDLEV